MEISLGQSQQQRQQMMLAPQMRQSLEFLQVPMLELRTLVRQEMEQNPTLEEQPPENELVEVEVGDEDARKAEEQEFQDEFKVLAQIDDIRTVADIVRSTALEEITVVSILGKLAEAGVLLVKAERQSRAEDDVELQAHRDSVWAEVSQLLDNIADGHGGAPADTARPHDGPAEIDWGGL